MAKHIVMMVYDANKVLLETRRFETFRGALRVEERLMRDHAAWRIETYDDRYDSGHRGAVLQP